MFAGMASHANTDSGLIFPALIQAARERRGFSQLELARRMGVSQAAVSQLESGKSVTLETTLAKVADGLGLTLLQMLAQEIHELQRVAAARKRSAARRRRDKEGDHAAPLHDRTARPVDEPGPSRR
jgi:transcriptional regulator with XRE-family HTH domain